MSATIEEVRESFKTQRKAITDLDAVLAVERKALKLRAFKERRPLSTAEVGRRKEIAATRMELADSLQELSLDILERLENASDVNTLLNELKAINQGLEDDLDRLGVIEKYADLAANVAAALASAAKTLAAFRPTP